MDSWDIGKKYTRKSSYFDNEKRKSLMTSFGEDEVFLKAEQSPYF